MKKIMYKGREIPEAEARAIATKQSRENLPDDEAEHYANLTKELTKAAADRQIDARSLGLGPAASLPTKKQRNPG